MISAMMKTLFSVFILNALAVIGAAQSSNKTNVVPDCGPFFITFTGAIRGSSINNIASVCSLWTLAYTANGFSALSIELDSAPDSNGTPGSWVPFAGTVATGTNPSTNIQQNQATFTGFYPWVSVNVTSVTGSGSIKAVVYGYKNSAASTGGGGGGGGSGGFNLATVTITSSDLLALNTTPFIAIAAPGAGKYTRLLAVSESYEPGSDGYTYLGTDGEAGIEFQYGDNAGIAATQDSLPLNNIHTSPLISLGSPFESISGTSNYENLPIIYQFSPNQTGAVIASTLGDGGTGYTAGDDVFIACGNNDTPVHINTVSGGGVVTSYTVTGTGTGQCATGTFSTLPISSVLSIAVNSGGLGYAIDDTFSIDGSIGEPATGHVLTVDGMGAVLTATLDSGGSGYTASTAVPTTTLTGIGTGLTLNTTVSGSGFTINVTTVQALVGGNGAIKVTFAYVLANI